MKRAVQNLWDGMVTHNELDGLGSNLAVVEFFRAHWDRPGAHPLPFSVQVKERVQLYLHFWALMKGYTVKFMFYCLTFETISFQQESTTNTA